MSTLPSTPRESHTDGTFPPALAHVHPLPPPHPGHHITRCRGDLSRASVPAILLTITSSCFETMRIGRRWVGQRRGSGQFSNVRGRNIQPNTDSEPSHSNPHIQSHKQQRRTHPALDTPRAHTRTKESNIERVFGCQTQHHHSRPYVSITPPVTVDDGCFACRESMGRL